MSIIPKPANNSPAPHRQAFSLLELLVVVAIIAILSSILLPALARAKSRAQGVYSLNNTRQLTVATFIYSDDHRGNLPYNFEKRNASSTVMEKNWANNVLDWELSPDNTNSAALLASGIGPYTGGSASVYRCPTDFNVSSIQSSAGWDKRARSYSMNAMVGDAGITTQQGYNENNPAYLQFFNHTSIPRPSDIFMFIEEHPNTIQDGYFLNRSDTPEWKDLPSSDHDGSGVLSFADGHSEMHRWRRASTRQPVQPGVVLPPKALKSYDLQDFLWVLSTMSVERKPEYYH